MDRRVARRWLGTLTLLSSMLVGVPQGLANEPVTLRAGSNIELRGVTEGSENLTRMASRDRRRKLCLGYAASNPSHVVVLADNRPTLRMAVDSGGEDTTLFIQGPDGIYCNDNARRGNRDAAVTARDWTAGTYRVWVGAFNRGDQLNYRLRVYNPSTSDNGQ